MYNYINKRKTRGNMASLEGNRLNKTDKELRQAIGEVLAKKGFDPTRILTNLTIQLCQDKECSDCGLKGLCKQVDFKDRVIGINIIIESCDKG